MNNLEHQTSPYLLQHANNPVNWYPWCDEAFEKAKKENKPIFLSIGYSTCHWCHVMAHESFEDEEVAALLNRHFISIKVDKEERPDIDHIYMSVCQAFTGSGGWPTSIFMTPFQKPFFAGTYFPKHSQYRMPGLLDLLKTIADKWQTYKEELIRSSEDVMKHLRDVPDGKADISEDIILKANAHFRKLFDTLYGGFGDAPKFPTPHSLFFLMEYAEKYNDTQALEMAEKTLIQMYKGGVFDHIGFGFSRYSTDRYFLVPHFEKMLYDNALCIIAYARAFDLTKNNLYQAVAEKTAQYILRELTDENGGFYSAQDADSDGIEGKYYVFTPDEILRLLGKEKGTKFNDYYGITSRGNFEGKSIPNLLHQSTINDSFSEDLTVLYEYRKSRTALHLDDKILTSWNALTIAAFSFMFRIFQKDIYLKAAQKACEFLNRNLRENDTLFVSFRQGIKSAKGFLDDYAFYIFAMIGLYEATLEEHYLHEASHFCKKTIEDFFDQENGGFYIYGDENEQLIMKPKETYDGAIPSGNAVMAYNLVKLAKLKQENLFVITAEKQLAFIASPAAEFPTGHSFYLSALMMHLRPEKDIVCVLKNAQDRDRLKGKIKPNTTIRILSKPDTTYRLLNDQTTFYVCRDHHCLPPTNDMEKALYETSE